MIGAPDLSRYAAVTFDVLGTLVDWEPEIAAFLRDWTAAHGLDLDDAELLARYDRLRRPLQDARPALRYEQVLGRTLDAMAAEFGCPLPDDRRTRFARLVGLHRPFPDSREALLALRRRGLVLGALSNIDDDAFARLQRGIGLDFDLVVTAERVGAYKPDPAHFHAALADLLAMGIAPERVLHAAQSRRADVVPANALGLDCVWIDRSGHAFGRTGDGAESARPDFEVASLAALARA